MFAPDVILFSSCRGRRSAERDNPLKLMCMRCCSWLTWFLLVLSSSAQSGGFPVCLVQSPGFVECTPGGLASEFSGYDVAAFRFIAGQAGWIEVGASDKQAKNSNATSYYFACTYMTAPEVVAAMSVNTSNCSMAAGAWVRMRIAMHVILHGLQC